MSTDVKKAIADEAVALVTGARRAAYGTPAENFERIAALQAAYMGSRADHDAPISPLDVAFLNIMQKVARLCETPNHRDSYVDLVGYTLCAAEVAGVGDINVATNPLWQTRATSESAAQAPWGSVLGETERWLRGKTFSVEPAPLRIEVGKFYRARCGAKIGPMTLTPGGGSRPWTGWIATEALGFALFGLNGTYRHDGALHPFDLVEEWTET